MASGAKIEAFLEMMAAERGAGDNTLSSYRRDLEDADHYLAARR
jgi:integrase/recombinase XerD